MNAITPTGLRVCKRKCKGCLFTPKRIVTEERAREVLDECRRTGSYFLCHEHSIEDRAVICRGFFNAQTETTCQLAKRLSFVQWVNADGSNA